MRHYEHSTDEDLSAEGLRFAVVASRYNRSVTDALLEGAVGALREAGAADEDIDVARVPGAFELPLAAQTIVEEGDYDAVVALGCIVRGDTPHFDFVAQGAMNGLMRVSLDSGIPVGFGVLTTENQQQAEERARPDKTNKGREAALTALEMAVLLSEVGNG
jgi:6,7-dimethyl-8-ribityllumazine synthase